MALAILNQGKLAIRNSLKALVTHGAVSTDTTAFNLTQTTVNPGGGTNLIKTATNTDVDNNTFDSQITIDGTTEFTGQNINTISALNGAAATNALTRIVRTGSIGVQSGDVFTVGSRIQVQDNS